MQNFTVKATLSQKDLTDFYIARFAKSPLILFFINFGILEIAAGCYLLFGSNEGMLTMIKKVCPPPPQAISIGIMFLAYTVVVLVKTIKSSKMVYQADTKLQYEIAYTFNDDNLGVSGFQFESAYKYDELYKLQIMNKFVVLYVDKHACLIIPKNAFSSEQLNFAMSKVNKY